MLPVQILPAEAVESRRSAAPTSIIATLPGGGCVFEARADEGFQRALLALVADRKRLRDGAPGTGAVPRGTREALEGLGAVPCRVLGVEQSNTSIVYNNQFFLKLFRKVEEGENPDIELSRFLTEKPGSPTCRPSRADRVPPGHARPGGRCSP